MWPKVTYTKLSSELQLLYNWLGKNRLTINGNKTKRMYFYNPRKGFPSLLPSLLQTKIWSLQRPINILVCYLVCYLTYREHISKLTNKLHQKLYVYNKTIYDIFCFWNLFTCNCVLCSFFRSSNMVSSMSPTFTALLPKRDVGQVCLTRSISQALIPVPVFRNSYGQRSFIRTLT